jgi:hypothetical protein
MLLWVIMTAYLIAGPSGSGKSTVGRVLQQRGFRVIETDFEDGLSGWFNNDTGERVTDIPSQPYSQDWVAAHRWSWDKVKMEELLSSVGKDPVFFCGGAFNERDFYSSFEKRFGLYVDNETMTARLQVREPKRWVKGSAELERQLEWNEKFRDFCISSGATVIDGSTSPDTVANAILQNI